jgi:tetratricopeptide (TPR) repeat protein
LGWAKTKLASFHLATGEYDLAEADCREALKLYNAHTGNVVEKQISYRNAAIMTENIYGQILCRCGRYAEAELRLRDALQTSRQLLKEFPTFHWAVAEHHNLVSTLVVSCASLQRWEAACDVLQEAIEAEQRRSSGLTNGQILKLQYQLGECRWRSGDVVRGREEMRAAIEIAKRSAFEKQQHLTLYFQASLLCPDETQRAAEPILELLKEMPGKKNRERALALLRAGQWGEAIEAFEKLEVETQTPEAFNAYAMSIAYSKLGDVIQAQQLFSAAQAAQHQVWSKFPHHQYVEDIRAEAESLLR